MKPLGVLSATLLISTTSFAQVASPNENMVLGAIRRRSSAVRDWLRRTTAFLGVTGEPFGFPLLALVLMTTLSLTGCMHVRVYPRVATVHLGESVTFTPLLYERKGPPRQPSTVKWKAFNITHTRRHRTRISPDGTFTARLPGTYRITAHSGLFDGHALVTVPDTIAWNPKLRSNDTPVSSSHPGPEPPHVPDPPFAGPGWLEASWRDAYLPANRLGPARSVNRGQFRLIPLLSPAGTANYVLGIPLLNLPGRGGSLDLTLFYNSELWVKVTDESGTQFMLFDHGHGFPAPGWSLGFGKVIQMGSSGVALVDRDGTLHPFEGKIRDYAHELSRFEGHTTDGTFIDCAFPIWSDGSFAGYGQVKYPNGTVVDFGAGKWEGYPTKITDANGNYITIAYVNNLGPAIDHVVDTLGRVIAFSYDTKGDLRAITAPSLGSATGTRMVVKLDYRDDIPWDPSKNGFTVFKPPPPSIYHGIRAIYFPTSANGYGYWFGDKDSYSPYGMIAKVSQRRAMHVNNGVIYDTGTVTREKIYDYPTPSPTYVALADAPTYTTTTETWAGMDTGPAITHYAIYSDDPTTRRVQVQYPDGTYVEQKMYNAPLQYNDGLVYEQTTYDKNLTKLHTIATSWSKGEYSSAKADSVTTTDYQGATVLTKKVEYGYGAFNQISDVREFAYEGTCSPKTECLLRHTHTNYVQNESYLNRQIFTLPLDVTVMGGETSPVVSQISYGYDEVSQLFDTPGVVNHSDASNPYAPVTHVPADHHKECDRVTDTGPITCTTVFDPPQDITAYDPNTFARGNRTTRTEYAQAASTPELSSGAIATHYAYDIDGNRVVTRPDCCDETVITHDPKYQFAYPTVVIRGAAVGDRATPAPTPSPRARALGRSQDVPIPEKPPPPPPIPAPTAPLLKTSMTYRFDSGLPKDFEDANGVTSSISYDVETQRPLQMKSGTGATVSYTYDDDAMTMTTTTRDASGGLASQSVVSLNGCRLPKQIKTLAQNGAWHAIETQYDVLGRTWKTSQPFQIGSNQTPLWNELTYDALGRIVATTRADHSQTFAYYNESLRPSSAATSPPGQTVRTVDAVHRERWIRMNALGQLLEVVEPAAYGDGSLSFAGDVETSYDYDAVGDLTSVRQGPSRQQRDFQYDSLGRLTAEYLPEKNRSLSDSGAYLGWNRGHWSDVYAYDDNSNLTLRIDARGVQTHYDYASGAYPIDPLNRLQRLSYSFAAGSISGNISSSSAVSFEYMSTGDVTRPKQIAISQGGSESWLYDSFGRVASKTVGYGGALQLTEGIQYDSLSRATHVTQPADNRTRTLDYSYDIGGMLKSLTVDGVAYASNMIYDLAGQTASIAIGPGGALQTTETSHFNPATGRLSSQVVQRGNALPLLLNLSYAYDPSGQLHESNHESNDGNARRTYTYDAVGRLQQVERYGSTKQNLDRSLYVQSIRQSAERHRRRNAARRTTIHSL